MNNVVRMSQVLISGVFAFGLMGAAHGQQEPADHGGHGDKPGSLMEMMGAAPGSRGETCSQCSRGEKDGGMAMSGGGCMQRMGGMMSSNAHAHPVASSALAMSDLAAMVPLDISMSMRELAGEDVRQIQAQLDRKLAIAEGKMLKARGELKIALASEQVDRQAVAAALRAFADAQSEVIQARLDAQATLKSLTASVGR